MKNVAIVCEYNPFHLGHKHQIDILRGEGAECIICVMSGNFTQRGEPAIVEKYTRAHAALLCGADIVLELPFPYSSLSAEGFARAGAYIADCVGADTLCFGSECGDLTALSHCADVVSSPEFEARFYELQRSTNSSTSAYFQAYRELSGDEGEFLSNDILGISYIRAINELELGISPLAIKRVGGGYNDREITQMPSAMAIREILSHSEPEQLRGLMPDASVDVIRRAFENGSSARNRETFFRHIQSFFRLNTPDEITSRAVSVCGGESILDDGDGILQRICACAAKCNTCEEFYSSLFNARYTNTRIQRVILYSLAGVSDTYRKKIPTYTLLLGASAKGCEYLSSIRKTKKINIVTKAANIPNNTDGKLSMRADMLFTMLCDSVMDGAYFCKRSPVILK